LFIPDADDAAIKKLLVVITCSTVLTPEGVELRLNVKIKVFTSFSVMDNTKCKHVLKQIFLQIQFA